MAKQTQTPPQASKPIPFVKGPPLLGNLSAYNSERLDLLLRITRECGDVGGMDFGPFPVLIFNTSDYVHAIFVEHAYDFDKGVSLHSTFRPVIGHDLFMSEEMAALIRLKPGELLSEEALRDYCRANISHNKVPKYPPRNFTDTRQPPVRETSASAWFSGN